MTDKTKRKFGIVSFIVAMVILVVAVIELQTPFLEEYAAKFARAIKGLFS